MRIFKRIREWLAGAALPEYPAIEGTPWEDLPKTPRERIRLIGRDDAVICEAEVQTMRWDPSQPDDRRNNLHAYLPVGATLPLWYGGTYTLRDTPAHNTGQRNIYFSLPSGLENIWGQGNDFDTDAVRIHPEDLERLLAPTPRYDPLAVQEDVCHFGPGPCQRPPRGWHCTLRHGHAGPCPAWPDGPDCRCSIHRGER